MSVLALSGQGLVHDVGVLLLVALCLLILWLMGRFFGTRFGAPAIAITIWDALFVLLGGFFLVNLLMSLAGHPLITW